MCREEDRRSEKAPRGEQWQQEQQFEAMAGTQPCLPSLAATLVQNTKEESKTIRQGHNEPITIVPMSRKR